MLAASFPPPEFLIFAVAVLIGLIGKIVEFARKVRRRSIESQRQETPFGSEPEEAPEPLQVEPAPPLELVVRRPLPRPPAVLKQVVVPPPVRRARHVVAPPPPDHEHPILKKLREPHGARDAILFAEILGRPKALQRWR